MVEEGAGAGFHVFHVPLPVRLPEFAVFARHDFGFEAYGGDGRGGAVPLRGGVGLVAFAVATHADDAVGRGQGAGYSCEAEGGPLVGAVHVRDESDGGHA